MTDLWLDTARFPGRASLDSVLRSHQPRAGGERIDVALDDRVRALWAELLGVARADLLLVTGHGEALGLIARALVTPDDTCALAEPVPASLVGAVLACGGRYVDLGRLADGRLDAQALARVANHHPGAVLFAQAPCVFGCDDLLLANADAAGADADEASAPRAPPPPFRAVIVDQTRQLRPNIDGSSPALPVDARIVALRDPDDGGAPLLHAICCAPGTGGSLAFLLGPSVPPLSLLQRAAALLEPPARNDRFGAVEAQLVAGAAALATDVNDHPGVIVHGRAGVEIAIECLAGDSAALASRLQASGWRPTALGGHAGRSLIVVDLLAWRPLSRGHRSDR